MFVSLLYTAINPALASFLQVGFSYYISGTPVSVSLMDIFFIEL